MYTTRGGEMLDEICYAHYGNDSQSTTVLRANPDIVELPFILPSGIKITLPEQRQEVKKSVTLW